MNNKGQGTLLLSVVTAIMIFIAGMLIMNFLKEPIDLARDSDHLDCSNMNISDGNKVACLGVDIVTTYWMWAILSAAGGVVMARILI